VLSPYERRPPERRPDRADDCRASVVRMNDVGLAAHRTENRAHGHARGRGLAAQHARRARAGELPFAAQLPQLGHEPENVALSAGEGIGSHDVEHMERRAPTASRMRAVARCPDQVTPPETRSPARTGADSIGAESSASPSTSMLASRITASMMPIIANSSVVSPRTHEMSTWV
jgi:hypothetical protein